MINNRGRVERGIISGDIVKGEEIEIETPNGKMVAEVRSEPRELIRRDTLHGSTIPVTEFMIMDEATGENISVFVPKNHAENSEEARVVGPKGKQPRRGQIYGALEMDEAVIIDLGRDQIGGKISSEPRMISRRDSILGKSGPALEFEVIDEKTNMPCLVTVCRASSLKGPEDGPVKIIDNKKRVFFGSYEGCCEKYASGLLKYNGKKLEGTIISRPSLVAVTGTKGADERVLEFDFEVKNSGKKYRVIIPIEHVEEDFT